MKKKKNKDLEYYMSLNYPATIELYEEDGKIRFGLQVPELSGVWAEGKTIEEAYADLIGTKKVWFGTCLEKGIDIPEPVSEDDFSGKFLLRIPTKLHMALSKQAKKEGLSLNQYVKSILETHTVLAYEKQKIEEQYEKLLREIKLLREKSPIFLKPILIYTSTSSDDESKPKEKEDIDTLINTMAGKRSLSVI